MNSPTIIATSETFHASLPASLLTHLDSLAAVCELCLNTFISKPYLNTITSLSTQEKTNTEKSHISTEE
jgi:hypothetical protein